VIFVEINERMFRTIANSKFTEAELAKYLELGTGQISTWKKRKTDPPAKYIANICEFLGVSLEYMLTGKTTPNYSSLNENEKELLAILNSLSARDQIKLIGCAENYAGNLLSYCNSRQEASNE
jgi:transcriptional regulator with XRE-family HTH domain